MAVARSRSSADMLRDLKATEQRLDALVTRWRMHATTGNLAADGTASRELLDSVEELLRFQRGAVDRLHQLWIEYAQASGQHAPQ